MNENENIEAVETENNDIDYINAIQELQKNSVDKNEYLRVKLENKRLIHALANGETIESNTPPAPNVDLLRKKLFSTDADLSNLEYIETALQLREALIANGERDPFLPFGSKVEMTADTYEKADRVADGLQYCIDFAEGDSGIFTATLQRITQDVMPARRR